MKKVFSLGNSEFNKLGLDSEEAKYVVHNIDLSATNDSHSLIVNRIISNTNNKKVNVLDVGCNTGSIGIELVKHNCTVDGIEYSKKYYDILKKSGVYENIYNISVSDFNSKGFKSFYDNKVKYDYIIFADVLEHLVNPQEVIYMLSNKLKPKGKIIISIPNIAHIDIIINLLNGKFNYSNEGLLDDTHLRFFTKSSFIQMITNIENSKNINYNVDLFAQTKVVPDYLESKELKMIQDNAIFNDEIFVIQNLFELTKSKTKQKRNYGNQDNFDEIVKNYYKLLDTIKSLTDQNIELGNAYSNVINSKWWKLKKKILFWKK